MKRWLISRLVTPGRVRELHLLRLLVADGAWTTVATELMPAHITKHSDTVGWASAALRALFCSSWGGTRKEGE